jgi:hypothetical protein
MIKVVNPVIENNTLPINKKKGAELSKKPEQTNKKASRSREAFFIVFLNYFITTIFMAAVVFLSTESE